MDALLAAFAQQGFELLAGEFDAAAAQHPDEPARQLDDAACAYVHFALRHRHHFQVMFGRGASPLTAYPDLRAAGQHAFPALLRLVEEGQRVGRLPPRGQTGVSGELPRYHRYGEVCI